jgi:DNA polymerase I-like protein with 3'-5' exonuclease and polymerase domains
LKFPILNLRESRTKKGAASTGKQALFELSIREKPDSDRMKFLRSLAAHRKARKLRGSYIENLQIFPDGRLHPQWRLLTKSGRYACTPAVNTLPKKIKQIFVAREGRELCGVDLSQAELRAMAFFANCKMLLEAYEAGADVHSFNAVKVFEVCPPKGFKKWNEPTEFLLDRYQPGWRQFEEDPEFNTTRDLTKRAVFASNYMAKLETVWRALRAETDDSTGELVFPDLPKSQVEAFRSAWFNAAPEIPQFAAKQLADAQQRGYYECPISGRRRFYKDKLDESDAANQPIQMAVASHMNASILRIEPRIRLLGCEILLQVHDSLVLEGPQGAPIRAAGAILIEELNKTISVGGRTFMMPADPPKYGLRLSEI